MKSFQGRVPSADDGWKLNKQFNLNNLNWSLYIKQQEHSPTWLTCKFIADGKAMSKANYWFGFNIKEKQFAFARDLMTMKANNHEMYDMLCNYFLNELSIDDGDNHDG